MVVNLSKLDTERSERLQFIPRKKRKASEALKAEQNRSVPALDVVDRASESIDGKKQRNEVQLPAWRLAKEQQTKDEPMNEEVPRVTKKWTDKSRDEMTERDWRIMLHDLQIRSNRHIKPILSWNELRNKALSNYLSGSYRVPTPVQRAAIGLTCTGGSDDLVAIAPTGSGKTIGFLVPIFEKQIELSLVLAPTRELAAQISEVAESFAFKSTNVVLLVGGHEFADQEARLNASQKFTQTILIATPGRLLDFITQKLLDLRECQYLVFDEADRMIDMGFEPQITSIMDHMSSMTSAKRQTLMFSATWPREVQTISAEYLASDHFKVDVGSVIGSTNKIHQEIELFGEGEYLEKQKIERLVPLVSRATPPVICFVATKAAAESIAQKLAARNINCDFLHGGLSQSVRDNVLTQLRNRRIKCLVATDVASRGVDVPGVSLVVNYDLPSSGEIYVHRIGRTGRAGSSGKAVSFATNADAALFPDLKIQLRRSGSPIPAFLN